MLFHMNLHIEGFCHELAYVLNGVLDDFSDLRRSMLSFIPCLLIFSISVDKFATIQASVCMKGGDCKMCGTPPSSDGGQWVTIQCQEGPLIGNEVQLINPTKHLGFCEVRIIGTGTS